MWFLIGVGIGALIGFVLCAALTDSKINDLYEIIRELEAKNNDGSK